MCAIGAVFACAVKKLDSLKGLEMSDSNTECNPTMLDSGDMRKYLRATGAFTMRQLEIIEGVFEGWNRYRPFNANVEDSEERMTRIMQHIIENKGEVKFPLGPKVDDE